MTDARLKVLCINGWCRNGSTIIGNVLNEVPGLVHVGELHFLWRNAVGMGANDLCGCGRRLVDCELWSRVLAESAPAGTSRDAHARATASRQRACVRTRHTWRNLSRGVADEAARLHAATMARAYGSIAALTGCRVVVDSTKMPGESTLLPHLDGVDPFFLHLVRDPRAAAHSWSAAKGYVHALPAWRSTAYWVGFNMASEAVSRRHGARSLFLRYEDFIADPKGRIGDILSFVGEDPSLNPLDGRSVTLGGNHTVTGNPDRFSGGPTVIRPDDDGWRGGLTPRAKAVASAISWPLRRRYGYV